MIVATNEYTPTTLPWFLAFTVFYIIEITGEKYEPETNTLMHDMNTDNQKLV